MAKLEPSLMKALADSDELVRFWAVKSLTKVPYSAEVIASALMQVQNDPSEVVREAVAEAIDIFPLPKPPVAEPPRLERHNQVTTDSEYLSLAREVLRWNVAGTTALALTPAMFEETRHDPRLLQIVKNLGLSSAVLSALVTPLDDFNSHMRAQAKSTLEELLINRDDRLYYVLYDLLPGAVSPVSLNKAFLNHLPAKELSGSR
jgi:hypothetical protein